MAVRSRKKKLHTRFMSDQTGFFRETLIPTYKQPGTLFYGSCYSDH